MDNPYFSPQMNVSERTRNLHPSINNNNNAMNQNYHGFSSHPEADQDYQNLLQQKKNKNKSSIINLTSDKLKKEFIYKDYYLKSNVKIIFFVSLLVIIVSLVENKYLKSNELSTVALILGFLSVSFCFILIVNLNAKVLLDTFGYAAFYLFAILETLLFFSLFVFKCFKFFHDFKEVKSNRHKVFKLFYFIVNCVIILATALCLKFIWNFFWEALNTLTKREKTLFQKQLELNLVEKNEKGKLEFVEEEEKLDNNDENSKDNMKIE